MGSSRTTKSVTKKPITQNINLMIWSLWRCFALGYFVLIVIVVSDLSALRLKLLYQKQAKHYLTSGLGFKITLQLSIDVFCGMLHFSLQTCCYLFVGSRVCGYGSKALLKTSGRQWQRCKKVAQSVIGYRIRCCPLCGPVKYKWLCR